jgi:hypothetical protein
MPSVRIPDDRGATPVQKGNFNEHAEPDAKPDLDFRMEPGG